LNNYRIFETDFFADKLTEFTKQYKNLSLKLKNYVYPQLKENPHFGKNIKKLKDYTPDTWRYRIGKFRFFYEVHGKDKIVFMINVDWRKDSY